MSTLKSSRNSIRLWENPCFTSVSSSLFLTKSNTSSTFSSLTGHAPSSMSNSWRYSLLLSWHGNKWKLGCLGLPWSVLNTMIKVFDNSTECYMYYVMVVKSWIPKFCLGCTGSKDFLVHSTGKNIIFLCKSNETSIFLVQMEILCSVYCLTLLVLLLTLSQIHGYFKLALHLFWRNLEFTHSSLGNILSEFFCYM